jgi:hypothetical protein
MKDYKHLYNAAPKISTWEMIRDGLILAAFFFASFVFVLLLSVI